MRHRPDFDDAALARAGRALVQDIGVQDIGPVEPLLPRPLSRAEPRRLSRGAWRLRALARTLG
ncbi:hypothetical protein HPY25_21005, partial [Methylobacterium sp. IIF4SW-B5]|nr:hypothetical protein [Methylobacterium ajmalii]